MFRWDRLFVAYLTMASRYELPQHKGVSAVHGEKM